MKRAAVKVKRPVVKKQVVKRTTEKSERKRIDVTSSVRQAVDFSKTPDLSCKDWEKRIKEGRSLMPECVRLGGKYLDMARAARASKYFSQLKIPDVHINGECPTFGEAGGEWFEEIVSAVFGTFNGVARCVNEFFFLVPKKNSKTTNSAGIMVTALLVNERPRAEFLLIAPTQAVATLAFAQAVGMIEAEEELARYFDVKDYKKKIIFLPTKASLQIKSFDPSVLTGVKPAGALLDELHVIAEHHNADRVIGQLRGGLISQPEGFLITITTQSERVPAGMFRSELMKARKIRDGELKLKMLPILYEFPEEFLPSVDKPTNTKWRDSANWWMVTPNRDRSITIARLKEEYEKAEATGEEELRRWASQHLNIEIGMALRSDHWIGAKFWLKSNIQLTLTQLIERSEILTVGIDGGGLDDMLAITVTGRDKDSKAWLSWSKAWIHEIAVKRRPENEQRYKDFARDGDLVIVETSGQDIAELGDVMEQVLASKKLDKVGVDAAGIGGIIDELSDCGIDTEKQVVAITQGWRLTSAIKTAERKLSDGTLLHAIQPLTTWCAENARVEPRGNAILITKEASGSAKIDPLMSEFSAIELMSRNPKPAEKKYQMFVVGGGR